MKLFKIFHAGSGRGWLGIDAVAEIEAENRLEAVKKYCGKDEGLRAYVTAREA